MSSLHLYRFISEGDSLIVAVSVCPQVYTMNSFKTMMSKKQETESYNLGKTKTHQKNDVINTLL